VWLQASSTQASLVQGSPSSQAAAGVQPEGSVVLVVDDAVVELVLLVVGAGDDVVELVVLVVGVDDVVDVSEGSGALEVDDVVPGSGSDDEVDVLLVVVVLDAAPPSLGTLVAHSP
jgi:hypothetical protein